ncbi:Hypothetical_protein [Hexamita inflata]|uniref:Hypothetical_protein n=1 Tax=Hexamita inflata TaxID=28002 RepID=A0AA86VBL3_9EUKA|nr:Hypothetical protein HINF_LOCUS49773 [Hexamita inflata]
MKNEDKYYLVVLPEGIPRTQAKLMMQKHCDGEKKNIRDNQFYVRVYQGDIMNTYLETQHMNLKIDFLIEPTYKFKSRRDWDDFEGVDFSRKAKNKPKIVQQVPQPNSYQNDNYFGNTPPNLNCVERNQVIGNNNQFYENTNTFKNNYQVNAVPNNQFVLNQNQYQQQQPRQPQQQVPNQFNNIPFGQQQVQMPQQQNIPQNINNMQVFNQVFPKNYNQQAIQPPFPNYQPSQNNFQSNQVPGQQIQVQKFTPLQNYKTNNQFQPQNLQPFNQFNQQIQNPNQSFIQNVNKSFNQQNEPLQSSNLFIPNQNQPNQFQVPQNQNGNFQFNTINSFNKTTKISRTRFSKNNLGQINFKGFSEQFCNDYVQSQENFQLTHIMNLWLVFRHLV